MRALDRKLLRDLWHIRTQVLAIAAVIGSGVALFVLALVTLQSLRLSQETYYLRYGFADVFASAKRAPRALEDDIREIPGVATVETRVVVDVTLDLPDMEEPAKGRLVSVPEGHRPRLNDVHLRRGRYLEADRPDEVLVSEAFAEAHDLDPGDEVTAVINGRRRRLKVVGLALSPEYIYSLPAGDLFPDARRFGVFWMARKPLATAFDMEGGFNDVALALTPGASVEEVIDRLDQLLEPYGGLGAIPRALQQSHWYVDNEITQLQNTAVVVPVIFLAVAAFLLNVVLSRIVTVQREEIAALKAMGYDNWRLGLHYVQWGLVVGSLGALFGVLAGIRLSTGLLGFYLDYFHFPVLEVRWSPAVILGAVAVSLAAGTVGAVAAMRQVLRLPPAEAMRPAAPVSYRETWVERLGIKALLSEPSRMIVRNVLRRPVRTTLSVVGIAFSGAIMIVAGFTLDSMDEIMELQFNVAQRQDLTVSFVEPASASAAYELESLPGVMMVEPMRSVPVRLRFGHRSRQSAITGLPRDAELSRVVAPDYVAVSLPPDGLVLTDALAGILGVRRGDVVRVEVLEGRRPEVDIVVGDVVEQYLGTAAYMDIDALRRLLKEGSTLTGAALLTDSLFAERLLTTIKEIPAVAGVTLKRAAVENFEKTLADSMGMMIGFYLFFAGVIAFGVVYNGARISLSERSRELASLRVLGFTRAEISYILLGELGVVTLLAIPAGLALGYLLAAGATHAFETELYRFPLVVSSKTYLISVATVLVATIVSGAIVRRRLDKLDLVAVLKSRE